MNVFANYYQKDLNNFSNQFIPKGQTKIAASNIKAYRKYDYILLPNSLAYIDDIQSYIKHLKQSCHLKTRVIVVYFNFLWKPILDLTTLLGIRRKDPKEPNWLSPEDIYNLFFLEGFSEIRHGRRLLLALELGQFSNFINRFVAQLPLINRFCLTTYQIFRLNPKAQNYSVSVVVPARNEEGNIKGILSKIPRIGKENEVIFVEGHSTDNTYQAIKEEIKNNKTSNIKALVYKQKGRGKADAVKLGFNKAKNDILIILDADLTVDPKELTKFYRVLAEGYGDFANGSRLVYPMEKQAMRILNYIGNKLFSLAFTYLLGQKIKDTLCGTKALFREDYLRIKKNMRNFGDFDPFGDFDLLFGATKLNLKIVEVPVRYKERVYGKTNISRFRHGWLLLKMTFFAARKIKFI